MPNVLVVEADLITRNLMIRVLSRSGFRVYEAATAAEALALCQSLDGETLDLLIADHATTDGALTQQVQRSCPDTKILHISGWGFQSANEDQPLAPGSSFLQKPFTAGELLNSVRNLLDAPTQ